MGDVQHESGQAAHRQSPTVRGRVPILGVLLVVIAAAALIGFTSQQLRARQNLVGNIAAHDVPLFIPFYTDLQDRVDTRNTWIKLTARLEECRHGDPRQFVRAGIEVEKFIGSKLSPDDPRRMQVLLDIVAHADTVDEAIPSYWDLLNPAWRLQLERNYPQYVAALQKQYADGSANSLGSLDHLSQVLQTLGESDLELQTLRQIRSQSTVNHITAEPMTRLLQRLPPSDSDHAALQKDLDQYHQLRDQLVTFAHWFASFEAARAKGDLLAAEKLRKEAPAGPPNAFTVSADAHLAQWKIRLGHFDEGNRLREALLQPRLTDVDFEECAFVVEELAPPDKTPGKRARPANLAIPDIVNVRIQQWRAATLSGRMAEAPDLKSMFRGNEFAYARQYVDDESMFVTGQTAKLSPQARFEPRDSGLPPELAGSPKAWMASLELRPIGKNLEKQPRPHAELWLDGSRVLVIFTSPTPRDPAAKPATQRDAALNSENHVDLFFNPDRWFDTYTYVAVNDADTVYDARVTNADPAPRRRYLADKSLNLDIKVTSTPGDKGWQQRILLPREMLLPMGTPAIRFNIRQVRIVSEKGQRVIQIFSWHPSVGGATDHRADQFGWLLLPRP